MYHTIFYFFSQNILQKLTDLNLKENLVPNSSATCNLWINRFQAHFETRVHRTTTIGELGYELHIPKEECVSVYDALWHAGKEFNVQNVGYRALNSLSCESGMENIYVL